MGNHRADRRGPRRRPSDLPSPVASGTAGKRRAEKPGRRAAAPAVPAPAAVVLHEDEETLVLPITRDVPEVLTERPVVYQTSRIGGVRAAHTPRTAPSKPGARRSSSRAPLFRALPSAPVLLGLAALAVSVGGAVTAQGGLDDEVPRFSQASALSGASQVASASLLDRRTVSRDSRRDALSDAVDADLQDEVEAQNRERNAALKKFAQQAQEQSDKLRLNQWTLPLSGYRLTAQFGAYSGLWSHYHTGLDFAAPSGTTIHAVANGVVTSVGYDGAYGNKTVITLDDGTELWYCHQTSYTVSEGEQVSAGDTIGYVGSTGNVTGPHLHLEVRPGGGDPVDPYAALVVHGLQP
ncbi:M23 family metallopeptidase [Nocardioides soli]|uniref:Murein DD-endopeptidase MepM/ murein hydrolase activator NlpD n=1 Tax=Nocardioides soli TaxID=1036020 RepID=A0A7W4Z0A2_9ACTN|nr:M23 family metallopeptidase [Nocardioides soli]MBB3041658.1 murein DD-endopeptidase MepM/ murein hydrolase activator NlpD [Nocardioides soli]